MSEPSALIGGAGSVRRRIAGLVSRLRPAARAAADGGDIESRHEALVALLPDAVIVHCDGRIVFANPAAVELFGARSAADLIGKPSIELAHPENRDAILRRRGEILHGARLLPAERRAVRLDGSEFIAESRGSRSTWKGEPAILVVIRDVTERKRAEDLITRFGRIVERSINEIYVFDAQTLRLLSVNQGARENLGYSAEELGQLTPLDLKPSYTREKFDALIRPLRRGTREQVTFETVHRRKDGSTYDVEVRLQLMRAETPAVFVAIVQDITQRRKTEAALRESEQRFRDIVEVTSDWLWELDSDLRFKFVFGRGYDSAGFRSEEIVGRTRMEVAAFRGWRIAPEKLRVHQDDLANRRPFRGLEYAVDDAHGRRRMYSSSGNPVFDDDGNFRGYRGATAEITQRKQAEAALRLSEARFRGAFHAGNIGCTVRDAAGRIIEVNQAYCDLTGYSEDELLGTNAEKFVPAEDVAATMRRFHRIEHGETNTIEIEKRYVHKNGGIIWGLANMAAVYDTDGTLLYLIGKVQDITARKNAEAALRESEERFRAAFEAGGIGMFVTGEDGRFIQVNQALCDIFAYSEPEMLGRTRRELTHPDDLDATIRRMERVRGGGMRPANVEKRFVRKDGRTVWALTNTSILRDDNGAVRFMIGTVHDITDRKKAGKHLRESEERFRQMAENIRQVFWMTDPERQRMIYVNPAYEEIWGRSRDSLYREPLSFLDAVAADDRPRVEAALARQRAGYEEEYRIVRPDGSRRWIRDRAFPVRDGRGRIYRIVGIAEDVTEPVEREAKLRQAQKMEAVGQLTAGVAHDFNNLLTVIQGNLELLARRLAHDPALRDMTARAIGAARRGATLTHRLLAYARKQPLAPEPVDAGKVVLGMSDLLRRTLGETVEVELEIETAADGGLWLCEADPGQLDDVLLNLALNGRDAMPNGGRLTIEAANARLDDTYAAAQVDVEPGQYVMVSVTDTGVGMTPNVRERVFEPFFTTKAPGKGTGLGLSMVYGFVKQSGGHVSVTSVEGEGTTFRIYLPRIAEGKGDKAAAASRIADARGETVLVVEDDRDIRTLVVAMLRELGYGVLEAGTAAAALHRLDGGERAELLLTDIVLPGAMGGGALAREVKRRFPAIAVLYMSGHADDAIVHRDRLEHGAELLDKPFRKRDLAQNVRAALERARGAAA